MTYTAFARREGRFWAITVPETGSHTQARHIREAELMAREVIACDLELPLAAIDVEIRA